MAETPSQYKKAPARKKAPVKRVALSDEAKKAYEEMMQKRDAEQKTYGVHLDPASRRA
jgi:hypothetical protein